VHNKIIIYYILKYFLKTLFKEDKLLHEGIKWLCNTYDTNTHILVMMLKSIWWSQVITELRRFGLES